MLPPIEEIKTRIDIAELVQGYVRLQKSGVNYKANCPFHTEKTPSFYVTPSRQIWHCFGCGKGGDIFKFVMEIEGHDFPEALRMLASRAGVILKREDPRIRSERNRLYDISEEATNVFEKNLSLTPAIQTYLKKRGITDATIQKFRIGFAPQSWNHLLKALAVKNFKNEEIEKAGLAARAQDGTSWYDRFRSRIMFPIADINGRVIGFGGRIFETSEVKANPEKPEAKYVNTPVTPIYDKSSVLYGFDKAKQEIRIRDHVVIVEGYMDCVMSHQAGVINTVAVSGTALTSPQLKILRRLTGTIISSFDTDVAGDSATKRSLALAADHDFKRKIAEIPSGKDPADAVLENPTQWLHAVEHAKDVVTFYFDKALRSYQPESVEGKKQISGLVLPYIAELSDEIEKAHWVGKLAKVLGVGEEAVWSELRKKKAPIYSSYRASDTEKTPPLSRKTLLEEEFLALFAFCKEKGTPPTNDFQHIAFASHEKDSIFQFLREGIAVLTPAHHATLESLRFRGEMLAAAVDDANETLKNTGIELQKLSLKEKLFEVGREIQKCERENAENNIDHLLKTFREISASLSRLS